ncbi:MAG: homocysteine S-methyltransferase family protein [Lachnospiraceae bacterium]|nr:homocysteine S-methyltransferase family protein [Lachnospiraceae bacterium]
MTLEEFRQLSKDIIYLDGATGTNLMKRGMPRGVCPETWILDNREIMAGLQLEYFEAGTNIVLAPTFTANRLKLMEYGLEERIGEINRELVGVSKEARDRFLKSNPSAKAYVAADLTMTGRQLKPMGTLDFEELVDIYREQLGYITDAGVDVIIVETMTSLQETRAALIAARETCDLPVLCSLTFEENGRTLFGTDGMTAVSVLESLGAAAVGANCSTGPDRMAKVTEAMAGLSNIPIIAKPNAGMPSLDTDGNTVYNVGPDEFANQMLQLVESGASIIGGCCGTTPDHIRALHDLTKDLKPVPHKRDENVRFLSSEKSTVCFDTGSRFMIVGERINPTGKKKLQEELRNGSFEMVHDFALSQEENGAALLDINVGMSGIDEMATMLTAIEEVTTHVSLPLVIDSSHTDVIEQALRRYPGRALINSISYEKVKFDNLLPIAKKYGAMFILLPLSDEGLPKSLDEKKQIIGKILKKADELGISRNDIIVDGLVATVGANKKAALETLETIRYCKEELSLPTIVGLSNISFGLPERANVNSAFLNLAIQNGLTMAISNPSQHQLVAGALATDMLLNKEDADLRYIEYINFLKEQYPDMAAMGTIALKSDSVQGVSGNNGAVNVNSGISKKNADKGHADTEQAAKNNTDNKEKNIDIIKKAVISGNKSGITDHVKEALDSGRKAQSILDDSLLPGINEVGSLFESGRYFLPQLIASAEAMRTAIDYMEPYLKNDGEKEEKARIVIATVKGDIHDIGKNLVALMLRNYGFKVYDLGKDVSKEEIIGKAKEVDADIIALSALMTTTMQEMREVIRCARKEGLRASVMIGGAVITQDYADEIKAEGYSRDAQEAVKLAERLIKAYS